MDHIHICAVLLEPSVLNVAKEAKQFVTKVLIGVRKFGKTMKTQMKCHTIDIHQGMHCLKRLQFFMVEM